MDKKTDPSWIEELPDIDQDALLKVSNGKLETLSEPREMNFVFLDILDLSILDKIGPLLKEKGFEVNYFDDEEQKKIGAFYLEARKKSYIINKDNYVSDTAFFKKLADENGIVYDGWYGSNS